MSCDGHLKIDNVSRIYFCEIKTTSVTNIYRQDYHF